MDSKVVVQYGPYEANGIIKHRPQRLHGLIAGLVMLNIPYDVIETNHLDRVSIKFMEHEICSCNITNLEFNRDFVDDAAAMKLLEQIRIHKELFHGEHNVPRFLDINEGMRSNVRNLDDYSIQDNIDVISLIGEEDMCESEEDLSDLRIFNTGPVTGSEILPYAFNKTFIPSLETIVESEMVCSCTDLEDSITASETASEQKKFNSVLTVFSEREHFEESDSSLESFKLDDDASVFETILDLSSSSTHKQTDITDIFKKKLHPDDCGGIKDSKCASICECNLNEINSRLIKECSP